MPSDLKGRDPRRKKKAAYSEEELGVEDQRCSQPRASHHSKKSQNPIRNIVIKGNVHIENGNFNLEGSRDESRSLRSSIPARNPPRRLQPSRTTKRSTLQHESPSASEEDETSYSDDSEPEYVARKRPAKSMNPPELPRSHSVKKKRDRDEGYQTGTAYTMETNRQLVKGKERSISSSTGESSSSHPALSSSTGSRKSRGAGSETDPTSYHSDPGEEGLENDEAVEDRNEEDEDEDEEESDDDFGKLPILISNVDSRGNQTTSDKAVLDTGTKSDWISQMFYENLEKTLEVKRYKLSAQDMKKEYRDFNGNKFQPTFKVDLMIQSEEFKGLLCRRLSFLVARNATFKILLGRDTIRKEELMTRGKRDTDGEGALAFIHGKLPDGDKTAMRKKKEEQIKSAQERKKMREAKAEETAKRKDNANTSSSKGAANLATSVVSRSSKTRSPPKITKESPRASNSSMEGTW